MRKSRLLFLVSLIFILKSEITAQVLPPALKLGINAVTASKGTLDVELIASLIQEKQDEVKKEIIKRQIFDKLKTENYTLFEFSYNSLGMLLNSSDKKAIQRKLLENSANLALVYGFSEAYVSTSIKLGNDDLFNWLTEYGETHNSVAGKINSMKTNRELPNGYLFGLEALSKKDSTKHCCLLKKDNLNQINYSASSIIVDMVYDILVKEKVFSKLGFLENINTINGDFYREYNAYVKYKESLTKNSKELNALSELYDRMCAEAKLLSESYYAIKLLSESGNDLTSVMIKISENNTLVSKFTEFYRLKNIIEEVEGSVKKGGKFTFNDKDIALINTFFSKNYVDTVTIGEFRIEINKTIKKLIEDLKSGLPNLIISKMDTVKYEYNASTNFLSSFNSTSSVLYSVRNNDSLLTTQLNEIITQFNSIDFKKFSSNDIYFLQTKVQPLLTQLIFKYGVGAAQMDTLQDLIKNLKVVVFGQICQKILDKDNVSDKFLHIEANNYGEFLKIIQTMHELDKAPTYSEIMSMITNVKNILPSGTVKQSIGVITGLIEKYTEIDADSNKVDINVEEILVQLDKNFGNREASAIDFYMSVGLNQTSSIWYKKGFEIYETDTAGNSLNTTLNSLGFVSEKIGLKWKLINWKKNRSKNYGDYDVSDIKLEKANYKSKEPIVSDFHGLVYGSGILYNLVNMKTNRNFDYVIVGAAVGVSFYNGLDLNAFLNVPMVPGENFDIAVSRRRMYGFSFDIKFGEYIMAYRKKMAEKKKASE